MNRFVGPAAAPVPLEPDNIDVNKWSDTIWPIAVGLRSIVTADLNNDGYDARGSIATQNLTCRSRAGSIGVIFKRSRTPYFSWETAL